VHRCGVELKEATVGQGGGRRSGAQWTGVQRLASARRKEKTEAGHEQKTDVEKGELIGGPLPL
jgi:hypothetical protein